MWWSSNTLVRFKLLIHIMLIQTVIVISRQTGWKTVAFRFNCDSSCWLLAAWRALKLKSVVAAGWFRKQFIWCGLKAVPRHALAARACSGLAMLLFLKDNKDENSFGKERKGCGCAWSGWLSAELVVCDPGQRAMDAKPEVLLRLSGTAVTAESAGSLCRVSVSGRCSAEPSCPSAVGLVVWVSKAGMRTGAAPW